MSESFAIASARCRGRFRGYKSAVVFTSALLLEGCSRAPTFNILGSFFPSWLLCGVLGIVLAALARVWFVRTKFEEHLSPHIVVYPCLAALFTFTLWLVFFS
jgi:YtcA family